MLSGPPPNIVYLLADDLGYGDAGCYHPSCRVPTPWMDRVAAGGMRFTDFHTSSSVCTPTRYSILTGRYNWRSELKDGVLTGDSALLLERDRPGCAELLRRAGYSTACIGKWHLGLDWQTTEPTDLRDPLYDWSMERMRKIDYSKPVLAGPNDCGFDESFILPASLDLPPYVYVENGQATGLPSEESELGVDTPYLMRKGPAQPGLKAEDVLPEFTRRNVEAIERLASQPNPFFLYFPLTAPHTPIVPQRDLRGTTPVGPYGDFVSQVDAVLGEIYQALERAGVLDNTLLIFTSDNGASPAVKLEELAEMGHYPNGLWRGHKADLYEGGHRVPFLAHWPDRIAGGSVCSETICSTDFLATAASIAGVEVPENAGEDSADLTPLLEGRPSAAPIRPYTIHHSFSGKFAIRRGVWKFLEAPGSGGWSFPGDDDEESAKLPTRQLYRLDKDPRETTNLEAVHPEIADELAALLDQARAGDRTINRH